MLWYKNRTKNVHTYIFHIKKDDDGTDISDLLDEALDDPGESTSPKQQKREGCDQITLEDEGSLFHSVKSYRQQKVSPTEM